MSITMSATSLFSRSARDSSRDRWTNSDRRFGSAGQRIGQRIFLRLLEDDRVVDHGARLLGDPLEQTAVILGVVVRRRVIQRQAADERIVEVQRADDARTFSAVDSEIPAASKLDARVGVDQRAPVLAPPSRRAPRRPPAWR